MTIMAMIDMVWQQASWRSPEITTALLVIKATALLLATAAIALLMRRTSAGARHQVWLVALVALLAMPVLAAWSPLRLKVLPATVFTHAADRPVIGNVPIDGSLPSTTPSEAGSSNTTPVGATTASNSITSGMSLGTMLVAAWLLVVVLLMGWLLHGWYLVRRIVSRATVLDDPTWHAPLYEIADRLGLEDAPRLLRSSDVHMPFACGLVRGTIVLPAESDQWSVEQRTAVLIHELGHVRRHDLIGHTLGRVACALYWFHPLVWTAARRLRDESERACDDLALRFGARPSEYAEHLLTIVTSVRDHATPSIALAMAHRKEFEGRMLAILDPQLQRVAPSRWRTAPLIAVLGAGALVLGAAAPAPRDVIQTVAQHEVPPAPPATAPVTDPKPAVLPQPVGTKVDIKTSVSIAQHTITKVRELAEGAGTSDTQGRDERAAMLARLLRTDSSGSVRRIAAWGLMKFATQPVASDALIHALANDSENRVREMAAWALVEGDLPSADAPLLNALQHDKDSEVREMAVWGLGQRGSSSAAPTVGRILSTDPSTQVRSTAAWALGNMDLHTAPRGLIEALADSNDDVRYKASWALSEIGDKAALPALRKAMERETNPGAARAQLRAVIAAGIDPKELSLLLSSKHPEVRAAATRALSGDSNTGPWPWPWPRPIPNP